MPCDVWRQSRSQSVAMLAVEGRCGRGDDRGGCALSPADRPRWWSPERINGGAEHEEKTEKVLDGRGQWRRG